MAATAMSHRAVGLFSKLRYTYLGYFHPINILFLQANINNLQGDLTGIGAITKSLLVSTAVPGIRRILDWIHLHEVPNIECK